MSDLRPPLDRNRAFAATGAPAGLANPTTVEILEEYRLRTGGDVTVLGRGSAARRAVGEMAPRGTSRGAISYRSVLNIPSGRPATSIWRQIGRQRGSS